MNEIIQRFHMPITTGIVTPQNAPKPSQAPVQGTGESFDSILQQKLGSVTFSKHAQNRIDERGIDLSEEKVHRLHKGVELAREKGLTDVLVLVDKTAFIVNARSSVVITTVAGQDTQDNVFTNIQGTVIV